MLFVPLLTIALPARADEAPQPTAAAPASQPTTPASAPAAAAPPPARFATTHADLPAAPALADSATRGTTGVAPRSALLLVGAAPPATQELATIGRYVHYGEGDRYAQFEASYTYRPSHRVIRALRFGAGGMIGETYNPVWDDATRDYVRGSLDDVRFYYGLVALEIDAHRWFGLLNEVKLGVNGEGVGGGWLSALRVGTSEGVNLQLGGQLCDYVGHHAYLALQVPAGRFVKVTPQVAVENAPRGRDMGFRFSVQAEVRPIRQLGILLEGGGSARDVRHGGFAGGAGLATYF
jgi:hypothetical protein